MTALEVRRATDLHRTAQARLSAKIVASLVPLWRILDPDRLDATAPAWIGAVTPVVEAGHAASTALATAYTNHLRTLALPAAAPAPVLALPVLNSEALATSLLVTGPIGIKSKLSAGMQLQQAIEQAFAGSAAAAGRHALSGGREFITSTVREDPRASGMVRVTSPGACAFCEEIAAYSETNPALGGDFQCHDGCHCQPEPVFT